MQNNGASNRQKMPTQMVNDPLMINATAPIMYQKSPGRPNKQIQKGLALQKGPTIQPIEALLRSQQTQYSGQYQIQKQEQQTKNIDVNIAGVQIKNVQTGTVVADRTSSINHSIKDFQNYVKEQQMSHSGSEKSHKPIKAKDGISPNGTLFSGQILSNKYPTLTGSQQISPHHAPGKTFDRDRHNSDLPRLQMVDQNPRKSQEHLLHRNDKQYIQSDSSQLIADPEISANLHTLERKGTQRTRDNGEDSPFKLGTQSGKNDDRNINLGFGNLTHDQRISLGSLGQSSENTGQGRLQNALTGASPTNVDRFKKSAFRQDSLDNNQMPQINEVQNSMRHGQYETAIDDLYGLVLNSSTGQKRQADHSIHPGHALVQSLLNNKSTLYRVKNHQNYGNKRLASQIQEILDLQNAQNMFNLQNLHKKGAMLKQQRGSLRAQSNDPNINLYQGKKFHGADIQSPIMEEAIENETRKPSIDEKGRNIQIALKQAEIMFDSGQRQKEFQLPEIDRKLKQGAQAETRKILQKSQEKPGSRLSTLAGGSIQRTSQALHSSSHLDPKSPVADSPANRAEKFLYGGNMATVQSAAGTINSMPVDAVGQVNQQIFTTRQDNGSFNDPHVEIRAHARNKSSFEGSDAHHGKTQTSQHVQTQRAIVQDSISKDLDSTFDEREGQLLVQSLKNTQYLSNKSNKVNTKALKTVKPVKQNRTEMRNYQSSHSVYQMAKIQPNRSQVHIDRSQLKHAKGGHQQLANMESIAHVQHIRSSKSNPLGGNGSSLWRSKLKYTSPYKMRRDHHHIDYISSLFGEEEAPLIQHDPSYSYQYFNFGNPSKLKEEEQELFGTSSIFDSISQEKSVENFQPSSSKTSDFHRRQINQLQVKLQMRQQAKTSQLLQQQIVSAHAKKDGQSSQPHSIHNKKALDTLSALEQEVERQRKKDELENLHRLKKVQELREKNRLEALRARHMNENISQKLFHRHTIQENHEHLQQIQGNYLFPSEDVHHNQHIKSMKQKQKQVIKELSDLKVEIQNKLKTLLVHFTKEELDKLVILESFLRLQQQAKKIGTDSQLHSQSISPVQSRENLKVVYQTNQKVLKTTIKSQYSRNAGFDTLGRKKKVSEDETLNEEPRQEKVTIESLPENQLTTMNQESRNEPENAYSLQRSNSNADDLKMSKKNPFSNQSLQQSPTEHKIKRITFESPTKDQQGVSQSIKTVAIEHSEDKRNTISPDNRKFKEQDPEYQDIQRTATNEEQTFFDQENNSRPDSIMQVSRDPKLQNAKGVKNYVSNQPQIMIMEENLQSSNKNSHKSISESPYLNLIKSSKNNTKGGLSMVKTPTEVTELQAAGSSKISINYQTQKQLIENKNINGPIATVQDLKQDITEDSLMSMKKSETNIEGLKDMLNRSFAQQVNYATQSKSQISNPHNQSSKMLHVMQSFPLSSILELQKIQENFSQFEKQNAHILKNISYRMINERNKSFTPNEMQLMRENEKFPLVIQNQIIESIMKLSQTLLASKLIPDKKSYGQGFNPARTAGSFSQMTKKTKIGHQSFQNIRSHQSEQRTPQQVTQNRFLRTKSLFNTKNVIGAQLQSNMNVTSHESNFETIMETQNLTTEPKSRSQLNNYEQSLKHLGQVTEEKTQDLAITMTLGDQISQGMIQNQTSINQSMEFKNLPATESSVPATAQVQDYQRRESFQKNAPKQKFSERSASLPEQFNDYGLPKQKLSLNMHQKQKSSLVTTHLMSKNEQRSPIANKSTGMSKKAYTFNNGTPNEFQGNRDLEHVNLSKQQKTPDNKSSLKSHERFKGSPLTKGKMPSIQDMAEHVLSQNQDSSPQPGNEYGYVNIADQMNQNESNASQTFILPFNDANQMIQKRKSEAISHRDGKNQQMTETKFTYNKSAVKPWQVQQDSQGSNLYTSAQKGPASNSQITSAREDQSPPLQARLMRTQNITRLTEKNEMDTSPTQKNDQSEFKQVNTPEMGKMSPKTVSRDSTSMFREQTTMRIDKTREGQRQRLERVQPVVQTRRHQQVFQQIDGKQINVSQFLSKSNKANEVQQQENLKQKGNSQKQKDGGDQVIRLAKQSIELPLFNSQDPNAIKAQQILQGNQKQILQRKALEAQNKQSQAEKNMQIMQKQNPFKNQSKNIIEQQYYFPGGTNMNHIFQANQNTVATRRQSNNDIELQGSGMGSANPSDPDLLTPGHVNNTRETIYHGTQLRESANTIDQTQGTAENQTLVNRGNSSPDHTNPTDTGAMQSQEPSKHHASSSFIGSKKSMSGLPVGQSLQDMTTPQEAYQGNINQGPQGHHHNPRFRNSTELPRDVSVNNIEMQKGENDLSPSGFHNHTATLDIDAKIKENIIKQNPERIIIDQQQRVAMATSDDLATDRERYDARMEYIFRDQCSPEGTSLNVIEFQGMPPQLLDGDDPKILRHGFPQELSQSNEKKMMKHSSLKPRASDPNSPESSGISLGQKKLDTAYASTQDMNPYGMNKKLNQDSYDPVSSQVTLDRRSSAMISQTMVSGQRIQENQKGPQGNELHIIPYNLENQGKPTQEALRKWSKNQVAPNLNKQKPKLDIHVKKLSPISLSQIVEYEDHGITDEQMRIQVQKDYELFKQNFPQVLEDDNDNNLQSVSPNSTTKNIRKPVVTTLTKKQRDALANLYKNQQLQQQFYVRSYQSEVQKQQDKAMNLGVKTNKEGTLWAQISQKDSRSRSPKQSQLDKTFLSQTNNNFSTETDPEQSFRLQPQMGLSNKDINHLANKGFTTVEEFATKNANHLNLLKEPEGNIKEMSVTIKPIVKQNRSKSPIKVNAGKIDNTFQSPLNNQNLIIQPSSTIKRQHIGQEAIQAAHAEEYEPSPQVKKTIMLAKRQQIDNSTNVMLSSQSSKDNFTGGAKSLIHQSKQRIVAKQPSSKPITRLQIQGKADSDGGTGNVSPSPRLLQKLQPVAFKDGITGLSMQVPSQIKNYNNSGHKRGSHTPVRMPQIKESLESHEKSYQAHTSTMQVPGTAEMGQRPDEPSQQTLPTREVKKRK